MDLEVHFKMEMKMEEIVNEGGKVNIPTFRSKTARLKVMHDLQIEELSTDS
jgi:hypothetical protein